ncbi:MAG: hypothetical protein A3F11_00290 [Gammaproteobacteria bacterium RIFCSPHIGHO2_12_FULL_37_14]|nr:MAG: hypothetical protein A3F11_00290 [Gammaproteobacteria bacterium RIFCSPHIGHO2_12_FULL_37_14]
MTSIEQRAVASLATIMSLRMIGLFMALPIFSLYALKLPGATPTLIGLAMGIYGLTQAIFQIPFGVLSDRFGRKPIIGLGLIIFIIGSLTCSFAHSIIAVIIGRSLQGAGAVGSTILAMMADLTREEKRTISMAIAGVTIGLSFAIAMFLGPTLTQWVSLSGLFFISALFGVAALILLFTITPTPTTLRWHQDTEPEFKSFFKLLIFPELAKLNIGIFILHAVFTASFVVIPIGLAHLGIAAHYQWKLYLPILLVAFTISLICINRAERQHQLKFYFLVGIVLLAIAEISLWIAANNVIVTAVSLGLFFSGFSLLEAFLPSLISRTAPLARKGSALGVYSCAQFLGIFVGGLSGGWLFGKFGFSSVYLFCLCLTLLWLIFACLMQPPRYLITRVLRLSPLQQAHWEINITNLRTIPGMVEVSLLAEDKIVYLKMEPKSLQHPDFIRLKELLQSE